MKIACVCVAKNEDKYIQEWVEYHLKLGFDDIVLYQNNWRTNFNNPNLVKIEFDEHRWDRQVYAYNKFTHDYKSEYEYAAFFDVDEFLVLKNHKSIKDFLNDYEDSSFHFKWFYFGDNGLEKIDNNNYSVLQRFTKRGANPDVIGKSIINIKKTPFITVHGDSTCLKMDTSIAQLNHYYCKTKEEFEFKKQNRMDAGSISDHNYNLANQNEVDDHLAYNFFTN
jgi:hypothetical protein